MSTSTPRFDLRQFLRSLYDAAVAQALAAMTLSHHFPEPPGRGRTLVPGDDPGSAASGPTVPNASRCDDAPGDLIVTGPTFTNVNDFRALLAP